MMITTYVKLLRPHHWVKNLLLLFPPFFAGKILDPVTLEKVFPSLLAFSLAASCGYIINDIRDIEADKKHDVKKNRGMAAGGVSRPLAVLLAVILYITAMLIAVTIHGEYRQFQWFVILYLLNSLLYTLFFRNLIIVDIFLIAAGFLLRVLAGGAAFRIPVSSWLFLTVFTVSLLLAAGKRLGELITLGDHAHMHRKTLSKYSQSFLEGILWFSASAACVMYALYTLEHKNGLFYTVPVASFGLLRYIYIVREGKGDPTEALLFDRQTMGVGILWVVMIAVIIYQ